MELLKNRFYSMSLQKAREDEFLILQQWKIRMLEYALKFRELSHFAPAYVVDKRLKMNPFRDRLNLGLKEKMVVQHYALYEDMYNIAVNIKRATKEKNEFYNE